MTLSTTFFGCCFLGPICPIGCLKIVGDNDDKGRLALSFGSQGAERLAVRSAPASASDESLRSVFFQELEKLSLARKQGLF